MTSPPAAAPPRTWVLALWAPCRGFWVILLPSLFAAGTLFGAYYDARNGRFAAGLASAAIALPALAVIWFAAADIRAILIGEKPTSEKLMLSEIGMMSVLFAIFLVFSAIAAPAFNGLFRHSAEGSMKGGLATLRMAIVSYRTSHDGRAPDSLEALIAAKALSAIPLLWLPGSKSVHAKTNGTIVVYSTAPTDTGQWAYVVSLSSPGETGTVFIDCTHTDTRGSAWTAY